MRSSPEVVRLPDAIRGISVSRPVSAYDFSEEGDGARATRAAGDAQAAAEARVAAARAEGHRQGLAEGLARGRAESEAVAREGARILAAIATRLSAERASVLADAENDLLTLAVAVAARVVRREVAVDREVVVRVLNEALRRASPLEEIVVRVHPADHRALRDAPGVLAELSEVRGFELTEDRRVGQGGCLIETSSGAIDARLETSLQEIERALGGAASEEQGGADRA